MNGPILSGITKHSKKVNLRPPNDSDASILITWMSDLEVIQTLTRLCPLSIDLEKEWLAKEAGNPESVIWVIEFETDVALIPVGITGIHQISPIHRNATTGTLIGEKKFWGQGIAAEAMKIRTKFAFKQLGLHKLSSSYLDGNIGSAKAQAAAGYKEVGRKREEFWRNGRWVDEILTEVLAEDWFKNNPSE